MSEQPRIIGIFCFSGTGNTNAIAELLATEFTKQGQGVEVFAIDELLKENKIVGLQKYNMIGFGYPVHALNAPRLFFEFIAQRQRGNRKKHSSLRQPATRS